jgi:hypothetical protein
MYIGVDDGRGDPKWNRRSGDQEIKKKSTSPVLSLVIS